MKKVMRGHTSVLALLRELPAPLGLGCGEFRDLREEKTIKVGIAIYCTFVCYDI
jgi:hypothetical protein